jgi:hypothetical protein
MYRTPQPLTQYFGQRALAPLVLASLLCAAPAALAGPHEHGVAALAVVVDGERLSITLESPLDNLVGFEHAPKNDRQRAALARAAATLRDGGKLFRIDAAAGCAPRAAKVELPYATDAGGQEHDRRAHTDDAHSEASAEWEFACRNPAALKGLDIDLFDAFRGLKTLRVQTATPRGQGAATLTARRRALAL